MNNTKLEKLNRFFTEFTLIPNEYHARRGWDHYRKLGERRRILDESFNYTPKNIAKLIKLNYELYKVEINAWNNLKKLKREGRRLVERKLLDDHMVRPKFEFYTKSKHYAKINKEMDGNPIYELNATFFNTKKNHFRNWNELRDVKEHPLNKVNMCYSFHCLFFDSHLAKADLMRIDNIWFDIEVTHQVLIKMT